MQAILNYASETEPMSSHTLNVAFSIIRELKNG